MSDKNFAKQKDKIKFSLLISNTRTLHEDHIKQLFQWKTIFQKGNKKIFFDEK